MRVHYPLAAALASVAMGSAGAASATTLTYEYILAYEAESFKKAEVFEYRTYFDPNEEQIVSNWETIYSYSDNGGNQLLRGEDNIYGFRGQFSAIAPGTEITLSISIDLDSPYATEGLYRKTACILGSFHCMGGDYWAPDAPGSALRYGTNTGVGGVMNNVTAADISIEGNLVPGAAVLARFTDVDRNIFDRTSTLTGHYVDYLATFSFVDARLPDCDLVYAQMSPGAEAPACALSPSGQTPEIVAAPLPAPILLLGAGLFGLGLLARRAPPV